MMGSEFMADSGYGAAGLLVPAAFEGNAPCVRFAKWRDGTQIPQCAGRTGAGNAYFGISALTPST